MARCSLMLLSSKLEKPGIVEYGREHALPFNLTYSCESGAMPHVATAHRARTGRPSAFDLNGGCVVCGSGGNFEPYVSGQVDSQVEASRRNTAEADHDTEVAGRLEEFLREVNVRDPHHN